MRCLIDTLIAIVLGAVLLAVPALPAYAADATDLLGDKPATSYPVNIQKSFPAIAAGSWAVVDSDGNVVASHNGAKHVKIASVTKMMTAIVAGDYDMDTPITVSEYAAGIPGSSAYIVEGDVITLGELLEGLMLPSGNDAAYAIAEGLGEKMLLEDGVKEAASKSPEEKVGRFMAEVNERCAGMGLKDSFYVNPCGLDDEGFEGEHHSSAIDVALTAYELGKNPALVDVCSRTESDMEYIRDGENMYTTFANSNSLLSRPDVTGTKTGFTDAAGACLAGTVLIDGDVYYTAVLGCESGGIAAEGTLLLQDWIRHSARKLDYANGLEKVADETGSYRIVGKAAAYEWTDKSYTAVIAETSEGRGWCWEENPSVECTFYQTEGDIRKGDVVGQMDVTSSSGEVIKSFDVLAYEDVDAPDWLSAFVTWLLRLFAPLTGGQVHAMPYAYEATVVDEGAYYTP